MSYLGVYSLTGLIYLLGFFATLYGIVSFSPILFIEGVFLLWVGFSLTANVMEAARLTPGPS
jgi:hypothetical protein